MNYNLKILKVILSLLFFISYNINSAYGTDYDWQDPLSIPGIMGLPAWSGVLIQGIALTSSLLLSKPETHVDNTPGTFRYGSKYIYSRAGF